MRKSGSDDVISSESDKTPSKNMMGKMENGIAKPLLSKYTETELLNIPDLPTVQHKAKNDPLRYSLARGFASKKNSILLPKPKLQGFAQQVTETIGTLKTVISDVLTAYQSCAQ